jgi:hypothetical protein
MAISKPKPAAKKKPARSGTSLDAEKQAVAEQEAKLRAQMEKYQKLIEEAPKRAKALARARQEQLVAQRSKIQQPQGRARAALPDRRFELNAAAPARERRLRAERNQGRMMFFILLLVFASVVAWVYFTVLHST